MKPLLKLLAPWSTPSLQHGHALIDDISRLLDIEADCAPTERYLCCPGCAARVIEHPRVMTPLVRLGTQPVAYMVWRFTEDQDIEVLHFAVHQEMRRFGIGAMLLGKILAKVAPEGLMPARNVFADVPERNLGAQLFLRALGFKGHAEGETYRFVYRGKDK